MMKDCFAYRNGACNILTIRTCEGDGCRFYKTEVQLNKDRKKVFQRIMSLDEHTRNIIIDTYYDGKLKVLEEE